MIASEDYDFVAGHDGLGEPQREKNVVSLIGIVILLRSKYSVNYMKESVFEYPNLIPVPDPSRAHSVAPLQTITDLRRSEFNFDLVLAGS